MSSEENLLLKFLGLYFLVSALAGIFLSVYLFKLGGFSAVAKFGLVSLTFLFIFYIASGYFLKKYSQITLIRIGLIFAVIFYFLIFILKNNSIHYLLPLAALSGIAGGNFWPGFNLSQYIATHTKTRNEYFGKQNFILNIANSGGPLMGGAIILLFANFGNKDFGYSFLFLIVAILFLFLFIFLRDTTKHTGSSFSVRQIIKHKRATAWKIVLAQQFTYGLFDNTFNTFSAVLIFLIVKQEFNLGIVNSLQAIVYAVSSIIAIKILNKKEYAFALGTFFAFLGLAIFGLEQNLIGIIALIAIYYIFMPLLNISTSKLLYDVIDSQKENWTSKYYFLVERDSVLGFARIITYAILFFLLKGNNNPQVAKSWILIIPIFPLIIGMLQLYYKIVVTNKNLKSAEN